MKRISALLVVFMIVLMCALPTTAMAQFDSFKQKLINQGYTQEDLWAIDAILLYSDENVPSFIVGKYKTLKDWDKVCAYYGVDKKQFDNYIDGMKRWQEVLDKVPDTVMAEMKAKGWSQQEINEFVNKMNLNQIDYEYAWKEYKSGKTVDELVEAKVSENKAISELLNKFIVNNMTDEEYLKELAKIKVIEQKSNQEILEEAKTVREREFNRAKVSSGITAAEIEYCLEQGITNPMDMYRAKDIAKGNNVPFEKVVQTYLEVGDWSIVVIEVLNLQPEEYIKHLEESMANHPSDTDGRSKTEEIIQQIKDFYSLNGEGSNQDISLDDYIVLMVGSNQSYVYGAQKQIDEQNPDVSVFVENDRSYVPVRFLTESYGGSVEWIEETQTVKLFFGDNRISLKIGEKELYVNDEAVISDVAPIIRNERTFLPLRVCVNALGKQAFYSNGLILVSEMQCDLDETEDCKLIEEIIETYYK